MLRRAFAVAVPALLLGACAQPGREATKLTGEPAPAAPDEFPAKAYERAAAQGKPVYRIDPARSLIAITVRRGGSLARFGHDHVVASHGVQGYVAPDEGKADLYLPLNGLTVDEPALRAEAALDTQPSEADIAGTRDNMLTRVLDAQRFPFALAHVSTTGALPPGERSLPADVTITLHGVQRTFSVPLQVVNRPGEISASGSLAFDQSDFGIVPLSILGGAVQVQDRLSLRFALRASGQPD